jgi:hypothetical protein
VVGFDLSHQISVIPSQKGVYLMYLQKLHGKETDSENYKILFRWSIDSRVLGKSGRGMWCGGTVSSDTASEQRNKIVLAGWKHQEDFDPSFSINMLR